MLQVDHTIIKPRTSADESGKSPKKIRGKKHRNPLFVPILPGFCRPSRQEKSGGDELSQADVEQILPPGGSGNAHVCPVYGGKPVDLLQP
jgi:hypothetical protein